MALVLWIESAVLLALLAGSFFFAMTETALISADRIQIRTRAQEGDARAKLLERLLREPERFVTTVLVGNNIVNIVAASLATAMAIQFWGDARGAVIAAIGMTVIVLVLGEITPKTLAVQRALPLALVVARPIHIMQRVLRPISVVLAGLARGLLRLFGVKRPEPAAFVTQEQIQMLVREGVREGEVEHFEHKVIQEVFDFTETPVHKVMTPRAKVQWLGKDATLLEALELAGRTGHSRIPVVDGSFDHVLGFVHAKDLLRFSDKELRVLPVTHVLRAVLLTRADTRSDHVLARMQRERKLMSIVQADDSTNVGIATVEDLLEELVGEIHDEFDRVAGEAPGTGDAGH